MIGKNFIKEEFRDKFIYFGQIFCNSEVTYEIKYLFGTILVF